MWYVLLVLVLLQIQLNISPLEVLLASSPLQCVQVLCKGNSDAHALPSSDVMAFLENTWGL